MLALLEILERFSGFIIESGKDVSEMSERFDKFGRFGEFIIESDKDASEIDERFDKFGNERFEYK